jgi:hypothetical protein
MIDVFGLGFRGANISIFNGVGTNVWQTWTKPRNCTIVNFFVLGGGGGGGAGNSGAINTNRSGGGGGGSSGHGKLTIPASFLPDTLYILVGMGGLGGIVSSGGGSAGGRSFVSVLPDLSISNVLITSGNAGATGGNGGIVGSGNAAGGAAGSVFTQPTALLNYIGIHNAVGGSAGGSGGNINQSGTIATIANIVVGGSGGAGVSTTSRNGANITGLNPIPTIVGGDFTLLRDGGDGYTSFNGDLLNNKLPLIFTGGAGGYSLNNGTGGKGGNGSYGCGGGGGGAGLVQGSGGNGGNGLVIIYYK